MSSYGDFRNETLWPASRFVEEAVTAIDAMQAEGNLIDDINNMVDRAVYIFSGEHDGSVPPHNQEAIYNIFAHYNIGYKYLDVRDSGHGID